LCRAGSSKMNVVANFPAAGKAEIASRLAFTAPRLGLPEPGR
jgi:hypothetical protein